MLRKPTKRPTPSNWASLKPFGIGEQRPNNFMEVFRAGWENRDSAGYAWRILNEGVCDGCALGTKGMADWTIPGVHLCNVRLRLLRLNTMGAARPEPSSPTSSRCAAAGSRAAGLGRLPEPMLRRHGEPGFSPVGWDEALDLAAERIRAAGPDRCGFFLTSRGMSNESYYAAQKAVRAIGTNSIDNAARVCHSPSTFALKDALGVAATTCSYSDWIGTDVIVFIGSNAANNQPVTMKYVHVAKKAGTKVIVVNPYREPGMENYWIPSKPESAAVRDEDRRRVLHGQHRRRHRLPRRRAQAPDRDRRRRRGVRPRPHRGLRRGPRGRRGGQLGRPRAASPARPASGSPEFAAILAGARNGVVVWSMGVTQHERGEDNVRAIVNLALARGWVGREGCGLMPIRGHSGVQGGAEMGCYATAFPGGVEVDAENAAALSERWGFDVPPTRRA